MSSKAFDNIAPTGDGSADALTLVATLDATARRAPLPRGFGGNFIRIMPIGAAVRWKLQIVLQGAVVPAALAMIDNATATVNDPPRQGPLIGSYVADGREVERECPYIPDGAALYIAWQGAGAGTFLQIEKGSGKAFTLNEP